MAISDKRNDSLANYKELLAGLELGKKSQYETSYNPKLLQPVPRSLNRDTLVINTPFYGYDLWHMYELSCLNLKGKPMVFVGVVYVPCDSPFIIESKSFKLYLNSLNQTKLNDINEFASLIKTDLSNVLKTQVTVELYPLDKVPQTFCIQKIDGICLDDLDIEVTSYDVDSGFLGHKGKEIVTETLVSHLLKSNCLITSQPDWGSIAISYKGKAIDREGLLKYLISYRAHNEFHEHCVERIFTDICNKLEVTELCVKAYYTRRGGLDINPMRATKDFAFRQLRLLRQ